jgi:hypothetical protein
MASNFEDTWYPRIGVAAAEELRRYRRTVWWCMLIVPFASGAGILLGREGSLDKVIGGALAAAAVLCWVMFIRGQWRLAAALSVWFGVKRMRWPPKMTPERFDQWRRANGFKTPDERSSDAQSEHNRA